VLIKTPSTKCRVVKKITDHETFRCLKPACVVLIHNTPEPITLCLDCARELAKEIIDSTPDGKRDLSGVR
jgi:hypothetical protein